MPLARAMRAWARQSRRQKAALSMAGESKQERAAACLLQEVTNLALMLGNEADDEVEASLIQELMSRLWPALSSILETKPTWIATCRHLSLSIDRGFQKCPQSRRNIWRAGPSHSHSVIPFKSFQVAQSSITQHPHMTIQQTHRLMQPCTNPQVLCSALSLRTPCNIAAEGQSLPRGGG